VDKLSWRRMTCAVLLLGAVTAIASQAQTLTVLASFNIEDGTHAYPGPLVQATDGNFYGLTEQSGTKGSGTVFKITPGGTLTTLYSFGTTLADGASPEGGLIQATDGNFYGTTRLGGFHDEGTIFSITPAGIKTTLYNFGGAPTDGNLPVAGLIQATDGNFYGTTLAGGAGGASVSGTVFKITPGGALTTLHAFGSTAGDGIAPATALIQATDGNFYGTTIQGGAYNEGTVFKITPGGTLTTLYSFHPTNGFAYPSSLIQVANGNFYGTTVYNAPGGAGAVFEITPEGTLTTLYTFGATATDGIGPSGLIQAADGNFYGTTSAGGTTQNGTIFEITPAGTKTTLYSFGANAYGAQSPASALIQATDGNFYGVAGGGAYLYGSVFRFTPAPHTAITASGVVSASAFGGFSSAAPGSWVEIYGSNLAPSTAGWTGADFVGDNAPTMLNGVSVSIAGQAAFVDYVSATQVNAQLPGNIATGPQPLTVTNANGTSTAVNLTVNATEPGLLAPPSFKVGANQYVVAQHADGTYVLPVGAISGVASSPAKPGETIVIYGVGFGSVTPSISPGEIATETNRLSATFDVLFGKTPAELAYYGLAPNFVGLYQFNVTVPAVANEDLEPLTFSLGGVAGTQTLFTAVQE
jgi:uncharacterized protein (TIGR03437 family)